MTYRKIALLSTAVALLAIPLAAHDRPDRPAHDFSAQLRGRSEVPLTLSAGSGSLTLHVNDTDTSVHFVLEYSGVSGNPLFSHIHVGQPNVNGGVTVFFCGGGGQPACPAATSGTVEGDFTANNVLPQLTQQLEAGNLAKLLAAIRAGKTYANLHTPQSPGGEIRGQIREAEKHDN